MDTMSSSLPSLQMQQPIRSPYADDLRLKREVLYLRKRNQELEIDLKRLERLSPTAKNRELEKVYGQNRDLEKEEQTLNIQAARKQWEDEIQRVRNVCKQRLADSEQQHANAMAATLKQLDMLKAKHEEDVAAKDQKEKEERILQLQQRVSRRMSNMGLSRGWTAWFDLWEAKTYALYKLRQAANRLRRPGLAFAFSEWMLLCEEKWMLEQKRTQRLKEAGLYGEHAAVVEEMAEVRRQLEAKLAAAAEEKRAALEIQRIELTGSSEELSALQEQQLREERVEVVRRIFVRRIMQRDMSRGWTSWLEMWEARTYARTRMREVAGKLRGAEAYEAFRLWEAFCLERKHLLEVQNLERERGSLESQLRQARFEASQLNLVKAANDDEIKSLQTKVQELVDLNQNKDVGAGAVAEVKAEIAELQELCSEAQEAQADAERRLAEAERDAAKQQSAGQALLEQLLAEQRKRFDEETAEMKKQLAAKSAREEREQRIDLLRRMTSRRMMNQSISRGWSAWVEMWEAKHYAIFRLREVANHLRAPELSNAFMGWVLHWHAVLEAKAMADARAKAGLLSSQGSAMDSLQAELQQVRKELATVSSERMELRARVASLDGGSTEAERVLAEAEAKAKEERVELLRRQMLRRMLHSGIVRGFTAWTEMWESRTYAKERLRQAANRLQAPEIAGAFSAWVTHIENQRIRATYNAMQKKTAGLLGEHDALAQQLQVVREEYEAKLAAANEQRVFLTAKVAELSGGSGAQALLDAQAEVEREQRIEQFTRMFTRRVMNQSISRGWSAWVEMWEAKTYAMARLREVGNHLRAPELSTAFMGWVLQWHAVLEAKAMADARAKAGLLSSQGSAMDSLQAELQQVRKELATVSSERMELRARVASLDGGSTEAERVLAEAEAKAKEERVELLRRQMLRRMLHSGIVRGFTAWTEMWESRTYAKERLRQAANRLQAPALTHAFTHWLHDWMDAQRAKQLLESRRQAKMLQDDAESLKEEIQLLHAEYELKLKAAEESKQQALERQLVQLTGNAQDIAALRDEEEKERRVDLLRRQIGRRMFARDLSRGWTAWMEMYEAKRHAKNRLREAGNRLRAPSLSLAFTTWAGKSAATRAAKEKAELERQSKSTEAMLSRARYENGRLELVKLAQDDELKELRAKLSAQTVEVAGKDTEIRELSEVKRLSADMFDTNASLQSTLSDAEARLKEVEEESARQQEENKRLMEQLLADQRANFESQLKQYKDVVNARSDARKELEQELERVRDAAKKEEKALRDEIKKVQKELDKLKKSAEKAKPKKDEPKKVGLSAVGKNFDLDEGPDAKPISEQLAAALKTNSARVLDLFRDWDADGDGEVSRAEFRRAMPALGLNVPTKSIDELVRAAPPCINLALKQAHTAGSIALLSRPPLAYLAL